MSIFNNPKIEIKDLISEPISSFKLMSLYIGPNCKDEYCKILKKGTVYYFYSVDKKY